MRRMPDRADLDHLRKQAKALLRSAQGGDPEAIGRFERSLPAAARQAPGAATPPHRLHDAQSCLAREYGFKSWTELKLYAEARAAGRGDEATLVRRWLGLVYAGDVTGSLAPAQPAVAARLLSEMPERARQDPAIACATGDAAILRRMALQEPGWINRPGGVLALPPLVAVTHSSLVRLAGFAGALRDSVRFLLSAGADPDQRIGNRWPPASVAVPDEAMPLSALYGAAGQNRDAETTRLLLDAGADPNDGESLYHALESAACTELLLRKGARIAGTNALYRALDLDDARPLETLLRHGADACAPGQGASLAQWGAPLLWAIRRRRSVHHIRLLLEAGADPAVRMPDGLTARRLALRFGMPQIAALLRPDADDAPLPDEELFVAACTCGDAATARAIRARRPDLPAGLPPPQLRLLADMAAAGVDDAVRLMVELGWPIAVRGGDWDASALNHAVFRGDAGLTRFLLEAGASWRERHGFDDDVCGGLSWASCHEPLPDGDWPGCARALRAHGMPGGEPDGEDPCALRIDGRRMRFSEAVCEILLGRAEPD